MTTPFVFKCPACGEQIFTLAFQIDDSVKWRSWPFSITCDACGNIIEGYFSAKDGLYPKLKRCDNRTSSIVFSYSNTLPTPASLYYTPYKDNPITSVFMNVSTYLGNLGFNPQEINMYGQEMRYVEDGIVQYKDSLSLLYPLLRKERTNVNAFRKKLRDTMGLMPNEMPDLKTWDECYDLFHEYHKTIIGAISRHDVSVKPFLFKLTEELIKLGPDKLHEIKDSCYSDKKEFERALDDVNKGLNSALKKLPQILPAFFLDLVEGRLPQCDKHFKLVTASIDDIEDLYKDNFNLLVKYLPLIMASYNCVYNGDIDKFVDSTGNATGHTLADFKKRSDGQRVNIMCQLPDLNDAMHLAFNQHVRNGIDHKDNEYDLTTQLATYYYDNSDNTKSENVYLIHVAHMCIMQLRWLACLCYLLWLFEKV